MTQRDFNWIFAMGMLAAIISVLLINVASAADAPPSCWKPGMSRNIGIAELPCQFYEEAPANARAPSLPSVTRVETFDIGTGKVMCTYSRDASSCKSE
jgi:hypothetical protein